MTSGLGIDKLFEWIEKIWDWLLPFVVVNHFERGVVLRLGCFDGAHWWCKGRELSPGFHWIFPFGIEEVFCENVKPDGWPTGDQSITLKDGVQISFSYIVIWIVSDIRQLVLEVEDKDTVHMAVQGYVQEFLQRYNYEELLGLRAWAAETRKRHGLREKLVIFVNEEILSWTGVTIQDILIRDFAVTSFRNGVVRVLQ